MTTMSRHSAPTDNTVYLEVHVRQILRTFLLGDVEDFCGRCSSFEDLMGPECWIGRRAFGGTQRWCVSSSAVVLPHQLMSSRGVCFVSGPAGIFIRSRNFSRSSQVPRECISSHHTFRLHLLFLCGAPRTFLVFTAQLNRLHFLRRPSGASASNSSFTVYDQ